MMDVPIDGHTKKDLQQHYYSLMLILLPKFLNTSKCIFLNSIFIHFMNQ